MKTTGVFEIFKSEDIFNRDGWRCQICRKKLSRKTIYPHPRYPTLDHIIALAEGGTHERKNVQLACSICNSTKSSGTASGGEQLRLL